MSWRLAAHHIVDAIATSEQRVDQGEQLAPGPGRARTITQINELVGELLDPEPLGQRRGQQQPRGGDGVIVMKATSTVSRTTCEDRIEKVSSDSA